MSLLLRSLECATLVISGGDRLRWFNGMVTADLNTLKAGGVLAGLIVQKTGKLRAEVLVAAAAGAGRTRARADGADDAGRASAFRR